MKSLKITLLALLLVVIIAVSSMVFVSSVELFPFKRDVSFDTIEQSDADLVQFMYYGNATDARTTVASLYIRVEQEFNNQRRVYVDVQHEGNTELDTVTLKFQSSDISSVAFEGYSSTSYSIKRNGAEFIAVVNYERTLGIMEASTPLNFFVTTIGSGDGDFSLYLQTDMYMHYKQPLELTQLKVTKGLNINLPQGT